MLLNQERFHVVGSFEGRSLNDNYAEAALASFCTVCLFKQGE